MKKWIRRKLQDFLNSDELVCEQPSAINKVSRQLDQNGFHFTIYPAQGGTVVELRSYNDRLDRPNNKLYVVRDDQDLGKELDHIITLEALTR